MCGTVGLTIFDHFILEGSVKKREKWSNQTSKHCLDRPSPCSSDARMSPLSRISYCRCRGGKIRMHLIWQTQVLLLNGSDQLVQTDDDALYQLSDMFDKNTVTNRGIIVAYENRFRCNFTRYTRRAVRSRLLQLIDEMRHSTDNEENDKTSPSWNRKTVISPRRRRQLRPIASGNGQRLTSGIGRRKRDIEMKAAPTPAYPECHMF